MSKEKQCKCCKEYWWEMNIHSQSGLCPNCYDYVADLEAKLAEKVEQVKQLKLDLGMYKSVNEFINVYGIEKAREVLLQTEQTKKQDKISFCVEQLEKVKENLKQEDEDVWAVTGLPMDYCKGYEKCYVNTTHFIDNQIKQLKEGK